MVLSSNLAKIPSYPPAISHRHPAAHVSQATWRSWLFHALITGYSEGQFVPPNHGNSSCLQIGCKNGWLWLQWQTQPYIKPLSILLVSHFLAV